MNDELARWAAERARAVRAQAEAEAVAVLRNALIEASLGERPRRAPAAAPEQRAAPEPPPARPAPGEEAGELLWAYCVLRAGDEHPEGVAGVDEAAGVERVEAAGLAALVSRVPGAEFGEEPLRRNLNDLAWLERVARAHETVLDQALERANIVPLRLCTLYEADGAVREMLARERRPFEEALEYLSGRQEWGVKVLIDSDRLAGEARSRIPAPSGVDDETSEGGAYMLRRRFDRQARELAHSLAGEVARDAHRRLEACALDAVTRSPQNRDLSGHEGEMVLNAAYLVQADRVDELRQTAAELEAEHRALGARLEVTGPWPPYNFVPGGGTAAIA